MDRLGYTAMTAASRTMLSLQVRSNNLANVNTPGFRADLERAQAVAVEGYGYGQPAHGGGREQRRQPDGRAASWPPAASWISPSRAAA